MTNYLWILNKYNKSGRQSQCLDQFNDLNSYVIRISEKFFFYNAI